MTTGGGCIECGGRGGHVPGCAVDRAERQTRDDERRAAGRRFDFEQLDRRNALRGKSVRKIVTARDGGSPDRLTVEFTNGVRLIARLTGRELDGHGECSEQHLVVEVETKADRDAKRDVWGAWYDRDQIAHPRRS